MSFKAGDESYRCLSSIKAMYIREISMKKSEYWTGTHIKPRLKAHIVFIPKYRKRVLRGKVVQTIKILFYQACEVYHWLTIESNHVHILLQYKPSTSISEIIQIMKGCSSHQIRKTHPELEEFLWWDSFWADGYFAESVWVHQEEMIQRYIDDQWQ